MGGRKTGGAGDVDVAPIVCDASPLIALARIGLLDLLHDLFSVVVVPPAVARETPRIDNPTWIVTRRLTHPVPPPVADAGLGAGETEAIALAVELGASRVILDDRQARSLADALGVPVVGTLGVLLLAKDHGLLASVQPAIEALLDTGFHLAPWVIDDALFTAKEAR